MIVRALALLVMVGLACERADSVPSPPPPTPTPVPTPIPRDATVVPTRPACELVVLHIDPAGVWIGAELQIPPEPPPSIGNTPTFPYGAATIRCYAPGFPLAWIRTELGALLRTMGPSCDPDIMLAAAPSIAYARIVEMIDAIRSAGFKKVVFLLAANVVESFEGVDPASVPHCVK